MLQTRNAAEIEKSPPGVATPRGKMREECVIKIKGKKEALKAHASQQNESLNGFIIRAIDEAVARDNGKT